MRDLTYRGVMLTFYGALLLAGLIITLTNHHPPAPNTTVSAPSTRPLVHHTWTKTDSLSYSHDQMEVFAQAQFACLSNLWGKESAWNAKAHNTTRVMGKTAGGIPQLLGMSPLTPPTLQIDRGLSYIYYRYTTPCKAWQHWQRWGWY